MNEPVSDGRKLYAHYVFSYRSKLAGAGERRAVFEGVAMITLREGLIADYREVAGSAPTLFGLGIPPGKVAKTLGRWDKALRERPESARHIA
ncbi:MAG: hypothetical protein FJX47_05110 [Alphaproteobacteria bacterium]|nr:hypothetical protein [Alphaproteobacteria bacterium]